MEDYTHKQHRLKPDDTSIPASVSKLPLVSDKPVHPYFGRSWKLLRQDLLAIVGEYGKSTIGLFQPLHHAGVPRDVLRSIALLSVSFLDDSDRDECVEHLSLYFASSMHSYHCKLGCIRVLVLLTSPINACWQLEEGCLKETLDFIMDRSQDWAFPEHSEALLLFEVRARCLRCMEMKRLHFRSKVDRFVQGSQWAADSIADAAKRVERSLKRTVPIIHVGLETAGDQVKGLIAPNNSKVQSAGTVASCASAAKTVTSEVRDKVKSATDGIRDASVKGIHMAAKKFEEERMGHIIVRDKNHRDVLMAAGKVGMATFGAVLIVGEAVVESTKSVSEKTVSVTADVVRHTYGDNAGQILQDGCDATGNILTTVTHVAMLESRVWTKSLAKTAGKVQFRSVYDNDEEEELLEYPIYFLDPTKAEAIAVVRKLQRTAFVLDTNIPSTTRV